MANKLKIKKGDLVQVLSGKDKGLQGKVISVNTETERVLVEGVNRVTKHLRAGQPGQASGGIQVVEAPIHVSNVMIVDPETGKEVPDDSVGEIWLHGMNIGSGYWERDEESRETFQNYLTPLSEGSHSEGVKNLEKAKWMRTGDFGVYHGGELYITGRVKDLVIVDGRNHYPQDLEFTAQESNTKYIRTGYVAAFSVPANELPAAVFENAHSGLTFDPNDQSEQLVIVAELGAGGAKQDQQALADGIRSAVGAAHGVGVGGLLQPQGALDMGNSGTSARLVLSSADRASVVGWIR